MNWQEIFRNAIEGILANKLRSILTILGIVIGVAAVIAVLAIGQGGRTALVNQLERLGANMFMVYTRDENVSLKDQLTINDVNIIKRSASSVETVSPVNYQAASFSSGKSPQQIMTLGTNEDYLKIIHLSLLDGRFLNPRDMTGHRKVAVIDNELATKNFGQLSAIGKVIKINRVPFIIIGVSEKESSVFNFGPPLSRVYLPINTWQNLFHERYISQINGLAATKEQVKKAIDQSIAILNRNHHTTQKYTGFNLEKQLDVVRQISKLLTIIISSIAAISLIVGGIGVMNIMLVSVTERTREIGIRKALGAQKKDILLQFLAEAITISIMGGIIGLLIGAGGALIAAKLANWPPLVSWQTVLVAIGFSTIIGILSGIYPANKAAKMDPIEALRYE